MINETRKYRDIFVYLYHRLLKRIAKEMTYLIIYPDGTTQIVEYEEDFLKSLKESKHFWVDHKNRIIQSKKFKQ